MKTLLIACLMACGPLYAATFTVLNLDDSGAGSLREAITLANGSPGPNEIEFDAGIALPGTITLLTALPDISEDLVIIGPATNDLVLERDSAAPSFRLLHAVGVNLEVRHLWLLNGLEQAPDNTDAEGGTIRVTGNLVMLHCVVAESEAIGGQGVAAAGGSGLGGAIFCTGSATLRHVAFVNCAARGGAADTAAGGDASGGAVHVGGALLAEDCSFDDCHATGGDTDSAADDGGFAQGGAIAADSATMSRTRVDSCEATGGANSVSAAIQTSAGGGAITQASMAAVECGFTGCIAMDGSALFVGSGLIMRRCSLVGGTGTALHCDSSSGGSIENSTFSGNTGEAAGAARFIGTGTILMRYCTVTLNQAANGCGGVSKDATTTISLEGCIVAANVGTPPDLDGAFNDLGFNLVGDATGATGLTTSVLVGDALSPLNPALGPLRPLGNGTRGHHPNWGSFVIDAGGAGAPFDDQRRANRNFAGPPDIGAVEFIVNQPPDFTSGPSVRVKAGSVNRTISGWASNIDPGAPWEAGQELRFVITGFTSDFESGPTIDPMTGDLHFKPRAGRSGLNFFTVVLEDDGGTANGGQDVSAQRTLVIDLGSDGDDFEDPPICSVVPGSALPLILLPAAAWLAGRRRRARRDQAALC